jgi:hypothetical protein
VLFTTACFAQEVVTVKGVVADSATLRSIPFVNVIIKHTTRGTTSDANGYFILSAHPKDTVLFSFIGYRTLELPVKDWEPSVVLITEIATMLKSVTIRDTRLADPYEHLFDEQNALLEKENKSLPFYYSKDKKERIMVSRQKKETLRVKNYVDLIVKNDEIKLELMKKHKLSEKEYYDLLTKFNEKNYAIMYYLTDSELLSLLYRFFDVNSPR